MIKYITIILTLFASISLANEWQVVSRMPQPVYGGQAVALDKYIYIFGGFSDSLNRPLNTIQIYDPLANEWKLSGYMRHARYGFVADKLDDSSIVYCGGMWNNSNDVFSIETWNPFTDGIGSAVVSDYKIYFNRVFFTGHVYEKNLYLFGGTSSFSVADSSIQPYIVRYNLSDRNITHLQEQLYEGTFLPYHHMSVRIDSIVYLFGGVHFNVTNKVVAFNLISHKIDTRGNMSGVRAGGSAVGFRNEIYILGGYDESSKALSSIEVYSLNENRIVTKSRLHYARKELMAVEFNGSIYVFGGKNQFDVCVPQVEKLDIVNTTGFTDKYVPAQIRLHENYPNPFNATTNISFDIHKSANVTLNIYSIEGRLVKTLFKGYVPAGNHRFVWSGNDNQNQPVSTGIYLYRLVSDNDIYTNKMVLVK